MIEKVKEFGEGTFCIHKYTKLYEEKLRTS